MDEIKKEKKELLQLELVPSLSPRTRGKKNKRRERQEELLKGFFSHQVGDYYEEKMVGDKWYVKNYNGGTGLWQVAIYSADSFRRYKTYSSN